MANIAGETRENTMTDQHGGYGLPTPGDRLNALRTPPPTSTNTNTPDRKKPRPEVLVAVVVCAVVVLIGTSYLRVRNKVNSSAFQTQVAEQVGSEIQKEAGAPLVLDGDVLFGVSLKPGNFPAELKVGDIVRAVTTPSISGGGEARELEGRMTVMSVDSSKDIGGETIVTLSGPQSATTEIAMSGPIHLAIVEVGQK